jgi:predicted hotdog family 3-hydroxylacyl-ACP dehydratase
MILIDELVAFDGEKAMGRVRLCDGSPFVQGGQVPALVAIEYMAQSIGLLTGIVSHGCGEPIQVGYLLGTRELTLAFDHFEVGDELEVEVERLFGEAELGAFRCEVRRAGKIAASAILNVYRNRDYVLPGRAPRTSIPTRQTP